MTLLMPPETWDTISTLCFNQRVLLVGPAGGQDVATIARVALITAVYPGCDITDIQANAAQVEQLAAYLGEQHLDRRVLLHVLPAPLGITSYARRQFDVVVFNPAAAKSDDVAADTAQLSTSAAKMIVIEPPGRNLWDIVTGAMPPGLYTASSDGTAIFVSMGAPEPIVRQD